MKEFKEEMIDALEEEKEFEKIKVTELEMIVALVGDKPYYSIRYFDIADMCWHIGYSSYDLKNVVDWKNECFEVVGTNGGWIPCSERLPEDDTMCVVYTNTKEYFLSWFEDGKWVYDNDEYGIIDFFFNTESFYVVEWQPLHHT